MLYNINFGNDIHVEPAIQNYPISQLRDFLKLQRLSEGRAKGERRTSEGRAKNERRASEERAKNERIKGEK